MLGLTYIMGEHLAIPSKPQRIVFMTEGMVPLGVAETVQEGNPQRKALCLRCQGKGVICIWDWVNTSTPQGKEQIAKFQMPVFVYL